jgi:hypothetical protein
MQQEAVKRRFSRCAVRLDVVDSALVFGTTVKRSRYIVVRICEESCGYYDILTLITTVSIQQLGAYGGM